MRSFRRGFISFFIIFLAFLSIGYSSPEEILLGLGVDDKKLTFMGLKTDSEGKYPADILGLHLGMLYMQTENPNVPLNLPLSFKVLHMKDFIPKEKNPRDLAAKIKSMEKYNFLANFCLNPTSAGKLIKTENGYVSVFKLLTLDASIDPEIKFFDESEKELSFLNYDPQIKSMFNDITKILHIAEKNIIMYILRAKAKLSEQKKKFESAGKTSPTLEKLREKLVVKRSNNVAAHQIIFAPWYDSRVQETNHIIISTLPQIHPNKLSALFLMSYIYKQYCGMFKQYPELQRVAYELKDSAFIEEMHSIKETVINPLLYCLHILNNIVKDGLLNKITPTIDSTNLIQGYLDFFKDSITDMQRYIDENREKKKKTEEKLAKKRAKKKRKKKKSSSTVEKLRKAEEAEEDEEDKEDSVNKSADASRAEGEAFKKEQKRKLEEWKQKVTTKKTQKKRPTRIATLKKSSTKKNNQVKVIPMPLPYQVESIIKKLCLDKQTMFHNIFGAYHEIDRKYEPKDIISLAEEINHHLMEYGIENDFLRQLQSHIHPRHEDGKKLPKDYVDKLRSFFIIYGIIPIKWEPTTMDDLIHYENYYQRLVNYMEHLNSNQISALERLQEITETGSIQKLIIRIRTLITQVNRDESNLLLNLSTFEQELNEMLELSSREYNPIAINMERLSEIQRIIDEYASRESRSCICETRIHQSM